MSFQLVRASDDEIVIWHVDHGHIFVFQIPPGAQVLGPAIVRDVPDAAERAETFREAALQFATDEARSRKLLAAAPKPGRRRSLACGAGL